MTASSPCDFSIIAVHSVTEGNIIRLQARDGLKVLVCVDVAPSDFLNALIGQEPVTAAITLVKP